MNALFVYVNIHSIFIIVDTKYPAESKQDGLVGDWNIFDRVIECEMLDIYDWSDPKLEASFSHIYLYNDIMMLSSWERFAFRLKAGFIFVLLVDT